MELMNLLWSSRMLWKTNEQGESEENQMHNLQCWEFHDLLFHARSRAGRHDHPAGGTYRFAGLFEPPAVLKEVKSDAGVIPLHKPDMDELRKTDPPYALVQEERCSIREYSSNPITEQQLGEFLYRVGRMDDYNRLDLPLPKGSVRMEFIHRPYPATGGLYELELFLIVNRCRNLDRAFYYYDPEQHRLVRISKITSLTRELIHDAGVSTGVSPENIQILIIVSARFQRIAWKYETLAYSGILKDVGVLYQTMYLSATAMGLAPCAVGYGNSDIFAKAAGTEYYTETSVGEFLLGSKR
jgi:SagB-type dehydrogenase family enzyme